MMQTSEFHSTCKDFGQLSKNTCVHTYTLESQLGYVFNQFHDFIVDFLVADHVSGASFVQRVTYILSHLPLAAFVSWCCDL